MSARILYREAREFDDTLRPFKHDSTQFVRVELRQWKDGAHHDTILDSLVVVDGDETINSNEVIRGTTDAGAIRHAIEQFDSLVASHPWANGGPRGVLTEMVDCGRCRGDGFDPEGDGSERCPECSGRGYVEVPS